MPMLLTPYVMSRWQRVGTFWKSISRSRCERNCFTCSEKM